MNRKNSEYFCKRKKKSNKEIKNKDYKGKFTNKATRIKISLLEKLDKKNENK